MKSKKIKSIGVKPSPPNFRFIADSYSIPYFLIQNRANIHSIFYKANIKMRRGCLTSIKTSTKFAKANKVHCIRDDFFANKPHTLFGLMIPKHSMPITLNVVHIAPIFQKTLAAEMLNSTAFYA